MVNEYDSVIRVLAYTKWTKTTALQIFINFLSHVYDRVFIPAAYKPLRISDWNFIAANYGKISPHEPVLRIRENRIPAGGFVSLYLVNSIFFLPSILFCSARQKVHCSALWKNIVTAAYAYTTVNRKTPDLQARCIYTWVIRSVYYLVDIIF